MEGKLQKFQEHMQIKEYEVERACGLALQDMSFRTPARLYSIFLHEQWVKLRMSVLASMK